MPSNDRTRSVVIELSERLVDLGFEITDLVGPLDSRGEEADFENGDEDTGLHYYLLAEGSRGRFYIAVGTDRKYGEIVYQMDVIKHLSNYLDESEVDSVLDSDHEWDDLEETESEQIEKEAVVQILSNSDPYILHNASFNLSAYASTSVVNYHSNTVNEYFPAKYQCVRSIFPYSEHMTLKEVDDRVEPVLIAGERGRRYVEHSFHIRSVDEEEGEYEFSIAF